MDRGRKNLAPGFAGTVASGAAAAQLSGVARGGERQDGDTTAGGDQRPDGPAAPRRDAAHHGKVGAHSGPEAWNCHFGPGSAPIAGALKRRRPATPFREPVSVVGPTQLSRKLSKRYPHPGGLSKECGIA